MTVAISHKDVAVEQPYEQSVPQLESGDRLTRAEFEIRYAAMPKQSKAEFVEGMVIMPSPTRHQSHGIPHSAVATWLGVYSVSVPGTEVSNNGSLRLDLDNELQPDVLLRLIEAAGGNSSVAEDDYLEGAPELIAEIAASSVSYDVHVKRHVYRRNGVREYLIWRVEDGVIDWFSLEEGEYRALLADEAGVVHSKVFPGLWLAAAALLAGDLGAVLATLQQGIASEEHAAFVKQLTERLNAAT